MEVLDFNSLKAKQTTFEVPIATHEQVIKAGDDYYIISARDSTIIKEINDIDKRLHVKYNKKFDFFVLYAKDVIEGNPTEYLVKTFTKLDARIVKRVEEISDPSYDFIKEGDDLEAEREAKRLYAIQQQIGDTAERLAHALRNDLGIKTHAYIDGDVTKKVLSNDDKFMGGIRTDEKNS